MSDNGMMKYLLTDHLGSTVAITDAAGTLLSETRFMPFGEPRADVGLLTGTDKTYISSPSAASGTGQRDVPTTGLMDYRARLYSPWLGRFIQPDSIVPGAGNPQSWNRFSYVRNSPIISIDPTGHIVTDGCNYEGCSTTETDQIVIKRITAELKIKHFTNVTLNGNIDKYSLSELEKILQALELAANAHGGIDQFAQDYGPLHFSVLGYSAIDFIYFPGLRGGIAPPGFQTVYLTSDMIDGKGGLFNILHEMAHVYDAKPGRYKYRSNAFVAAFSSGTCLPGYLGCLAENHPQQGVLSLYKFYGSDTRGYYSPSGNYARVYSKISSMDDFADSYALVVMANSGINAPYQIDSDRINIITKLLFDN